MITKSLLATMIFISAVAVVNIALWWYVSLGFYITIIQAG